LITRKTGTRWYEGKHEFRNGRSRRFWDYKLQSDGFFGRLGEQDLDGLNEKDDPKGERRKFK